MWDRTIDGKALNFHLAGINNQNFLMRDEETGSWWQQVTGEAIQGPLKGRKLAAVFCDEVSFAIWRSEQPRSRFLRPDPRVEKNYVTADWESKIARLPVVTPFHCHQCSSSACPSSVPWPVTATSSQSKA